MSDSEKPRIRVQAGSSAFTADSFVNAAARLGYGQPGQNIGSYSTYGFNPITRQRSTLEYAYRGSWLVRKIIDCIPEDMTRAGVTPEKGLTPDAQAELMQMWRSLSIMQSICEGAKWGRLYGGAIAVMMIDGQDVSSPLRMETIQKGMFQGLNVIDRWMCQPSVSRLVKQFGPDYGSPEYYEVFADVAHTSTAFHAHHSRVIRFPGDLLPYWQRVTENGWDASVIEVLYDRLLNFDSASQGAAQLLYKMHLRIMQVEGYREIMATGGKLFETFASAMSFMRLMQNNEGMTVIDKNDAMTTMSPPSMSGVTETLVHFGQQLSGACGIPLVRLFGQSPAGLNSTGESDIRNYYDHISSQQNDKLREPLLRIFSVSHRACFGTPLPEGFDFLFNPLWQLSAPEKATTASTVVTAVSAAVRDIGLKPSTALQELRASSDYTGIFTNITDEDIAEADQQPPAPAELNDPDVTAGMPGPELPTPKPAGPPTHSTTLNVHGVDNAN